MAQQEFDLIVVILPAGKAEEALEAAREAGAEGATIIHGRGTSIHEQKRIFNILVEPEKDILLMLVPQDLTDPVTAAIEEAAQLNEPGHGIGFVVPTKRVIGLCHPYPKPET